MNTLIALLLGLMAVSLDGSPAIGGLASGSDQKLIGLWNQRPFELEKGIHIKALFISLSGRPGIKISNVSNNSGKSGAQLVCVVLPEKDRSTEIAESSKEFLGWQPSSVLFESNSELGRSLVAISLTDATGLARVKEWREPKTLKPVLRSHTLSDGRVLSIEAVVYMNMAESSKNKKKSMPRVLSYSDIPEEILKFEGIQADFGDPSHFLSVASKLVALTK